MSSHTNWSMAHDFYYKGVDRGESHEYRGCSLSYRRNTAISYSTAIAKVVPAKGRKTKDVRTDAPETGLTLVSYYSMSNTTGRHISCVRQASPFECVGVPLGRKFSDFTPEDVAENFLEALDGLVKRLNTVDNRREFARLMACRRRVMELACEEWAKPLRDHKFRKYETLDVEEATKELQARRRKEAARAAAETRVLFAKYLPKAEASGADYCEFVRTVYDVWYHSKKFPFDHGQRAVFRKKFDKNAAYVWPVPESGCVRTSRGVSVPLDEAKALLKLWASGRDMRLLKVGVYTIVRYEGDTIQIGCHKIPRENMLALYEAVLGEKFPARKEKAA